MITTSKCGYTEYVPLKRKRYNRSIIFIYLLFKIYSRVKSNYNILQSTSVVLFRYGPLNFSYGLLDVLDSVVTIFFHH